MRHLAFAVLIGLSLSACAQSADVAAPVAAKPSPRVKEPSFAAGTPEARVRDALRALNPRIQVERIDAAPIAGFRQVIAGGQVIYVSDDGRYLFQGDLLDIANRKDLGEVAMAAAGGQWEMLEKSVAGFQQAMQRIRYATKPVVTCSSPLPSSSTKR